MVSEWGEGGAKIAKNIVTKKHFASSELLICGRACGIYQ